MSYKSKRRIWISAALIGALAVLVVGVGVHRVKATTSAQENLASVENSEISELKTCSRDISEQCCPKDKPKACPADCDKPCCKKEESKTCSQDSTKPCYAK